MKNPFTRGAVVLTGIAFIALAIIFLQPVSASMPDTAATPVMLEFQSAQTRLPAFSPVQAVEPKAELECSGTDFLVAERPGNARVDYERMGAASVQELLPGLKKVSFPSSKAPVARAELASDGRVQSVEADCLYPLAQDPNDARYLDWQPQLRHM